MLRVNYFSEPTMYTKSQVDLMNEFRELWSQHVYWTRMFIISTANDLADLEFVTQRLLKNPKDFAIVLKKFYGIEKANKFEKLFTEHLTIAAQLVNEAKKGNDMAVAETRKQWYKNANDIAEFLSNINPNWSQNEWRAMMNDI